MGEIWPCPNTQQCMLIRKRIGFDLSFSNKFLGKNLHRPLGCVLGKFQDDHPWHNAQEQKYLCFKIFFRLWYISVGIAYTIHLCFICTPYAHNLKVSFCNIFSTGYSLNMKCLLSGCWAGGTVLRSEPEEVRPACVSGSLWVSSYSWSTGLSSSSDSRDHDWTLWNQDPNKIFSLLSSWC